MTTPERQLTRGMRTHAHEAGEPAATRWVRLAAADNSALRRSVPAWAPTLRPFQEQGQANRRETLRRA